MIEAPSFRVGDRWRIRWWSGSGRLAAMAMVLVVAGGCLAPPSTRLTMAVSKGDVELTRQLVELENEDPDQRIKAGWTPLTLAASHGRTEIARILIDAGASVDRRRNSWLHNLDGTPPLTIAIGRGHLDIAKMLVAAGADVDAGDYQVGATPLMRAAKVGDDNAARLLLDAGADIAKRDRSGATALHYAVSRSGREGRLNRQTVLLLIERGADLEAESDGGTRPLHRAVGNLDVLQVLLSAGAQPRALTDSGDTVLSLAAAAGRLEVVWAVLPFFLDDVSAMELARSRASAAGHGDVLRVLESRAASPPAPSSSADR